MRGAWASFVEWLSGPVKEDEKELGNHTLRVQSVAKREAVRESRRHLCLVTQPKRLQEEEDNADQQAAAVPQPALQQSGRASSLLLTRGEASSQIVIRQERGWQMTEGDNRCLFLKGSENRKQRERGRRQ